MTTSHSNTLPIAEIFTSIHGEGFWAGTPMTFIRLAGCTVGKKPVHGKGPFAIINGREADVCTTFDNRQFSCDTDFHKTQDLTVQEILHQVPERIKHVCITGGEPLMHAERIWDLQLLQHLLFRKITPHFETSGTIIPRWDILNIPEIYWACSPKMGYLPEFLHYAHEVRIMADRDLTNAAVHQLYEQVPKGTQVYFAPLSHPSDVLRFDERSLKRCMELVEHFPHTRVSIQMHKVLNVR